jgi:8-oxo-dGTP diphosphatase
MTERDFLDGYDPNRFERPSLAVDLVLVTIREGTLAALLTRREQHPFKDSWTLPGGFVGIEESIDAAAARVLASKANLADAWLEQLYTFGEVERDPRMRIISVAYFALLPADRLERARFGRPELVLAPLSVPWGGEEGGTVLALSPEGMSLPLGFDHAAILGMAVQRLRGKLDYAPIAYALLPERFTLRELQEVHEAILGTSLNKPAFRRRMLDSGWIEATGERESGTSFRPAELYRCRNPKKGDR